MSTELLDAPAKTAVAAYAPLYAELAKLEEDNQKLTFNYESKKGNAEARNHVYKLRKSKGLLERTRVAEKTESLRIGRAIDSEAKEIEARIEAMIAVHQVKIDEIERREQDRILSIQARIGAIEAAVPMLETIGSEDLVTGIAELELVPVDDSFEEFLPVAARAKDARLVRLREQLIVVRDREAAAAELERLRAEAAERAQKDRDAAIAAEAVRKAQAAAAAQAEEQARLAAKAIADAETRAKKEREDAERRELQLKFDAQNSERLRLESEQRAAQEAKAAEARAEQSRLQAIQDEKDRVAAIAQAAADEQTRREANTAHLRKINVAAVNAFVAGGMTEDCAKMAVTLIAQGKIPAIRIEY
ncbi:hypothetical protein GN109_05695 [Collimonas pratensis]|uniref:hypothetical protein n=1 Tax=Collimonas pratensis TaxID=279113 RepID=UPI00143D8E05|nr:hypothetical protein [Collimonas pratensis]NKI68907.1 hypothetical protein [Collimonas pratensis]